MAAIESFWNIIKKERDGPCIGVRMLAARVSSPNERDALQALTVSYLSFSIGETSAPVLF